MKRRQFLQSTGGALALSGISLHSTLAAAADDFRWSRASAGALVGQSFWLNHPQFGAMTLALASVRDPASKQADPRLEQFSLLFRAAAGNQVADGTYDLDHATIGRFQLHLTPAGSAGDSALYRSDFTLLV